jgi:hypothetical protein
MLANLKQLGFICKKQKLFTYAYSRFLLINENAHELLKLKEKRLLERSRCRWEYIVTCRMVRATKMTGSSSDDWIYWHLGYKFS